MVPDTTDGLVAGRAESERRLTIGVLLAGAGVLALVLLEIFSDPVRDWAGDHPVVTALGTGALVIVFTALLIEGRARQRERKRTLGPALETTVALGSAGLDAARTVADAYDNARSQYDLELEEVEAGLRTEPSSPLPQLTDVIQAAQQTLTRTQDRWRGFAPFEDIAPALDYCRSADENMQTLLKQIGYIAAAPRILGEPDWQRIAAGVGLVLRDGFELAEIAKQANAEYIETEMAHDDTATQALRKVREALADNRDEEKSDLESLVERRKELEGTAWFDALASKSTKPSSLEPAENPAGHAEPPE